MCKTIEETNALIISILESATIEGFRDKKSLLDLAKTSIKNKDNWHIMFQTAFYNKCKLTIDLHWATVNTVSSLSIQVAIVGTECNLAESNKRARLLTEVNCLGYEIQIAFNE